MNSSKSGRKFSKKAVALVIIVSSVLTSFLLARLLPLQSSGFWETWYYTVQIVAAVAVISGVVIAVWQYYLSSKSTQRDLSIMQVQRAIDLSKFYKDSILSKFPAIRYVFDNCGALAILSKVKPQQFHAFDHQELVNLLGQDSIDKLEKIQDSKNFIKCVYEASEIFGLGFDYCKQTIMIEDPENHEKKQTIMINTQGLVIAFLSNLLSEMLNNMEFFAMHFHHGTADESVVYQSLHQSYLEIMELAYYYIAFGNKDTSSRLYTNVTWLFEVWYTRKNNSDKERAEKSRSLQTDGTIIK